MVSLEALSSSHDGPQPLTRTRYDQPTVPADAPAGFANYAQQMVGAFSACLGKVKSETTIGGGDADVAGWLLAEGRGKAFPIFVREGERIA